MTNSNNNNDTAKKNMCSARSGTTRNLLRTNDDFNDDDYGKRDRADQLLTLNWESERTNWSHLGLRTAPWSRRHDHRSAAWSLLKKSLWCLSLALLLWLSVCMGIYAFMLSFGSGVLSLASLTFLCRCIWLRILLSEYQTPLDFRYWYCFGHPAKDFFRYCTRNSFMHLSSIEKYLP